MTGPSTLDRFRGCLLGGAVGDALGAPVEFLSLGEIRRRYGTAGITDFDVAYGVRGAITDDTQMTLFTAEGLIRAEHRSSSKGICNVEEMIERAYLRWLWTQGEPVDVELDGWLPSLAALRSRRAPGNTCLSALRGPSTGDAPKQNGSKGCGAVMWMAPVGLVAEQPFDLGVRAGWITHGHPSGYLAAGYLAQVVGFLLDGRPLAAALDGADAVLVLHPQHEEVYAALRHARELASARTPDVTSVEELGEGWVAEEALAIAVYCALAADDFEAAVVLAVNHSGDTDSTGAITGNLLGTEHGIDAVPTRWLEAVELRSEIDQVARDLYEVFVGEPADPTLQERYPPW